MIKLTHLGQIHKLPFGYNASPKHIEETVKCQIKVANYIKSHPKAFVFLEGLTESYSGIPRDEMSSIVRTYFPDGLPDDAAKLNKLQQDMLYDFGAVRTMNYLGELKSMYRTISPEQSAIVDSRIASGDWSDMLTTREKAAMESVQEEMKKNYDLEEAILVYGDFHNFSEHCQEYGFEYEKVKCCAGMFEISENSSDLEDSTSEDHPDFLSTLTIRDAITHFEDFGLKSSKPSFQIPVTPSNSAVSALELDEITPIPGFEFNETKKIKLTDTITLKAKCKISENKPCLIISIKENDVLVPNTHLLFENKSTIDELIKNIGNPRNLIEFLKGKGNTANMIANYIGSHMD